MRRLILYPITKIWLMILCLVSLHMDKYACLDFLFLFLFYSKCKCRDLIACDRLIFLFSVYSIVILL